MIGKFFDKVLHEDEDDYGEEYIPKDKQEKQKIEIEHVLILFIIFLLALIVRLIFLFNFSDPQNAGVGWYGDTYHHWQIAYLSKEIGFHSGFLRLWDLKGLEFFWGLAHPLFAILFMALSGSSDIIVVRILSILAGSVGIVFLYLLTNKYWGWKVGASSVIIAVFNPVLIFNDASGMVEPLGIMFLLSALYFWAKKPVLTGLLLALASMSRAENWLFSLGLIFSIMFFSKDHSDKKTTMMVGYIIPILFYMKYLLDYTGNPIYPLWWNFLGNAFGAWQADIPPRPDQLLVQPIWIVMFVVSFVAILLVLWKKPKSLPFHLLGLGSFTFLGFFVGLTSYLKSYEHYFWVVRIFDLPYLYLGVLVSLFLFVIVPRYLPLLDKIKINWLLLVGMLIIIQPLWKIIWYYYEPTHKFWKQELELATEVSGFYKGGKVLIHEGDPVLTYALIRYGNLPADKIMGQMYDPFTYKPFTEYKDPFDNWNEDREIILDWMEENEIRLIIFHSERKRYLDLVERESDKFKFLKDGHFGLKIYEVKI